MPNGPVPTPKASDIVAIALSVGIVLALNLFTAAILWDALANPGGPEAEAGHQISENATQILTGWGGGIIGVIGALVGYRAGTSNTEQVAAAAADAARRREPVTGQ